MPKPWRGVQSPRVKRPYRNVSFALLVAGLVALALADLAISAQSPWLEMGRMLKGFLTPDLSDIPRIGQALLQTLAFGLLGVALGASLGFALSLVYAYRPVRWICTAVRAVHELFWGLLFLQFFGLHPLTGLLAIALPYAATFAKVYAEIQAQASSAPTKALPLGSAFLSRLFYGVLPQVWPAIRSYTAYRLECGLRSSAILGFIGLPTLGFYLETAFAEGRYSELAALLLLFFALIGSMRWWIRAKLLPVYLLSAPFFLGEGFPIVWQNLSRFFREDIVPAPLRHAEGWDGLWAWFQPLWWEQALPGIWNTLVLAQGALLLTAVMALLSFPLISRHFGGAKRRVGGEIALIVMRSTPEYLLAYILLQLWGPSMLPAALALALHNGAIIGFLVGRRSDGLEPAFSAARGLNRYSYDMLPRLYPAFLAYLLYRWEIILRETAILGLLGVHTLGFHIDSAIHALRFDQALLLIAITALLNIAVEGLSRRIRRYLARSNPRVATDHFCR